MRFATRSAASLFVLVLVFAITGPIGAQRKWHHPTSAEEAGIENGGFESGSLAGWSQTGWFVYSGTMTPSGSVVPSPPEGTFAGVTDQTMPGTQLLSQRVTIPPKATGVLTFQHAYLNDAPAFVTPETLSTAGPNQQYRVDILDGDAASDSVLPGEVLLPVFRTDVGDPASIPYTPVSVDLSPFAGRDLVVRFAVAVTDGPLHAMVDDVHLALSATCKGKAVTIFGTDGADLIEGTDGKDVILAGDGDDVIRAGKRKDTVCAGPGDDFVLGEGGKDLLVGQQGDDEMRGGGGKDTLLGKAGRDTLSGEGGADTLKGGGGKDDCDGGPGNDVVKGC